jgi:hypothetical protein
MRYPPALALAVFALGVAVGWFGHELLGKEPPPRAPAPAKPAERAPPPGPAPAPPPTLPPAPTRRAEEGKVPAEGEEPAQAADPKFDALAEMIHAQSKAWKGWAGMQAKQRAEALLALLPFDPEREKRIQELLQKEAELQVDRVVAMMLGEEEMDPDAFGWFMGLPEKLSPRLEGELATFLNDGEIQIVRAEVKRAYDKQMTDLADMQIGMMSIHDLSDDQRTRMREVFLGKDIMTEQFTRFAEITRDRGKMRRLLAGEGFKDEMERSFAPMRRRVRDILNDEQFAKYETYEQGLAKQAEMGLRMLSSLLGRPREETKEPSER